MTRQDMIYLLDALQELVCARIKGLVKIFASSRNENDIREAFKKVPNLKVDFTESPDIAIYIDNTVREMVRTGDLLGGNVTESLRETVCRTLERKAAGMFLWVHLQIRALGTMSTESEVIEGLRSLPTSIRETYETIFVQRIDRESGSGKRLAYLAMMWMLCSAEPLSPQELVAGSVTALMVESTDSFTTVGSNVDIETILKLCHNLVVIDHQLGVMRFVHFSAQEFLKLRWNEKETNSMAATVCLTILLEGTPQNLSDTYDDSAETYALRHWHTHVRLCGDNITAPKVVELLQRFLGSFETPSNAFISWLNSHEHLKWWYSSELLDDPNEVICSPPSVMPTICYYGFSDIIRDMWNSDQRFDVNMVNGLRHPLLSIASGQGNEWIISELIKRGAQIDQFCEQYEVALNYAAEKGQEGAFQLLLDNGADVNRVGDNNVSALSIATHKGYDGIAQIILNNGGHQHIEYALEIACVNGQLAVLQVLFENGADRSPHGSALFHSLRHTAELRKFECLKFLLSIVEENKAEIRQLDVLASNTLAAAVRGGSVDIISLICQEFDGADMDLPSKWWGKTALQIALEEGLLDVVNFLLVRGAKLRNIGPIELEDLAWAYNEPWYGELTALISNIQEPFSCTIEETLRVRKMFRKSFGLPVATVDRILELGEYWVKIRREREAIVCLIKDDDQEVPYISLLIKSNLRSPARKIIFTIRSHDQGRTIDDYSILGKGSYYASCTSFETAIHSPHSVTPEHSREIQRNLTCTERAHTQIITWDYRDNQSVAEWMKSLTTGYFLGVYPRVLHSGWENTVEKIDLQLFLAWGDIESELSEEKVSCRV
ncbi:ankyrin repeat-containing domain protein [Morchella snyderi]|nr:ankyrin repeat-containing domain protein [Morchella snyderi]